MRRLQYIILVLTLLYGALSARGQQPTLSREVSFTPDGTELWGNVIYSSQWSTSANSGVYSLRLSEQPQYKPLVQSMTMKATGGGAFYDGLFHWIYKINTSYGDYHYYYECSTADWQFTERSGKNFDGKPLEAYCTAYDPTTGNVYAVCPPENRASRFLELAILDYGQLRRFTVAPIEADVLCMAADRDGQLYVVDTRSTLYRLDKHSGALELVGVTGVPCSTFTQSMTIDHRNNRLYWAACLTDDTSALYLIDLVTAEARRLIDFSDNEEILCLHVPDGQVADAAPAPANALQPHFVDGNLTGSLTFLLPTVTHGGAPLTGSVAYEVLGNGQTVATGEGQPGQTVAATLTMATSDQTTFVVVLHNAAGHSEAARCSQWVGYDVPDQVYNLQLQLDYTTGKAQLRWNAPRGGIHGAYVDRASVVYDIVRYPGGDTVAVNHTVRTFSETLSATELTVYRYEVIPINHGQRGAGLLSNPGVLGEVCVPPYYEPFDGDATLTTVMPIIDANADGSTWRYTIFAIGGTTTGTAGYQGNALHQPDDWLLTPPLLLSPERRYELSFHFAAATRKYFLSAHLGQAADASDMTLLTDSVTTANSGFSTTRQFLTVGSEGRYRIGFHVTGIASDASASIDDICLEPRELLASPDSVRALRAEAGEQGALLTTLSMVAPRLTVDGHELTRLDSVVVWRRGPDEADSVRIGIISAIAPGTQLTFVDETPVTGLNSYTLVPYNTPGDPGIVSSVTVYVGIDRPLPPASFLVFDRADGTAWLEWTAPPATGVHGGYVDIDQLTYGVMNTDRNSFLRTGMEQRSIEMRNLATEGPQTHLNLGVVAANEIGVSDTRQAVAPLIQGAPYGVPFTETFTYESADQPGWWSHYSGAHIWTSSHVQGPYQDANVLELSYNGDQKDMWAAYCTGKIALKGLERPALTFDYLIQGEERYGSCLSVVVFCPAACQSDTIFVQPVGQQHFAGTPLGRRYYRMTLSLADYVDEPYVVVKFCGTNAPKGYSYYRVDNVRIEEQPCLEETLRPVEQLTATTLSDGRLRLQWQLPESIYEVTDDFESYAPWTGTADALLPWTLIDVDKAATYGLSTGTFPRETQPHAFLVFNPQAAQLSGSSIQARSGQQMLISFNADFASDGNRSNDWLISPLLPGTPQTVSLHTRAINSSYPETFEVCYTTSLSPQPGPADFQVIEQLVNDVSASWTSTVVTLPAGARRFALHHISVAQFGLMVDDVTFVEGLLPTAFRIDRDGQPLTTVDGEVGRCDLTLTDTDTHEYAVTALYELGESAPVNVVVSAPSDITSAVPSPISDKAVFDLQGRRLPEASAHRGIVILRKDNGSTSVVVR